MNLQTVEEIIACLPTGHTPFIYGKDDYALYLLSQQILAKGGKIKISDLKKSHLSALLQKPTLKKILAKHSQLTPEVLAAYLYGNNPLNLSLTLDTWGCDCGSHRCYTQTSRPGYNLVLQLNWDASAAKKIVRKFNQLLDFDNFCSIGHPARQDIPTIAWVRIDCDFNFGEALIEEVQSDWIRDLRESLDDLETQKKERPKAKSSKKLRRLTKRERYWRNAEKYLSQTWHEAALTAAISFIRRELGINTIFYHTFESGCELKGLGEEHKRPPRSLYTNLPKKFGMQITDNSPKFIRRSTRYQHAKRKLKNLKFYTLKPPPNEVVVGMYLYKVEVTFLLLLLILETLRGNLLKNKNTSVFSS